MKLVATIPAALCLGLLGSAAVPPKPGPRAIDAGPIGRGDAVKALEWGTDGKTLAARIDIGVIAGEREIGGRKVPLVQIHGQQVRRLDVAEGVLRSSLPRVGNGQMAVSPDGKWLARDEFVQAGGETTWAVTIRDVASGEVKAELAETKAPANVVAFSPDGSLLLTSGAEGPATWNARDGRRLARLEGHKGRVDRARFLPDGDFLITSGEDGTCRLWEARSGASTRVFEGAGPFAVTADGRLLVVWAAGKDGVRLRRYEIATGKPLGAAAVERGEDLLPSAFSPNGGLVAVVDASTVTTITLRETATGMPVRTFPAMEGRVFAAAFSPDGKTLATGGGLGNKVIRLWPLE